MKTKKIIFNTTCNLDIKITGISLGNVSRSYGDRYDEEKYIVYAQNRLVYLVVHYEHTDDDDTNYCRIYSEVISEYVVMPELDAKINSDDEVQLELIADY